MDLPTIIVKEWITIWAGPPSLIELTKPTKLYEIPSTSQRKIIYVEEVFQDSNKQMLEINYTLNFGQLLKIATCLKKYL